MGCHCEYAARHKWPSSVDYVDPVSLDLDPNEFFTGFETSMRGMMANEPVHRKHRDTKHTTRFHNLYYVSRVVDTSFMTVRTWRPSFRRSTIC